MTVSRVINNESYVSDATRSAVLKAIKKLNYAPSRAARSLAGAKDRNIALIYSNPSDSYLSELLMGSLQKVSASDFYLTIERCEADDNEYSVVKNLVDAGVEGFLLPSPLCEEEPLFDLISELGVRAFAIAPGEAPEMHSAVMIDDYRAARDMTDHIIGLGHKHIGFIVGNLRQSASALRLRGFRDAMADAGLEVRDEFIAQGEYTYRSGLAAAEQLLSLANRPTAVFASNDDMAAATVSMAHRCHLDVPSDLTVCGFDDTAIASTIWPELTTVRQPIARMAAHAVDVLAAELRTKANGQTPRLSHTNLDYRIVSRQSEAPPKG